MDGILLITHVHRLNAQRLQLGNDKNTYVTKTTDNLGISVQESWEFLLIEFFSYH